MGEDTGCGAGIYLSEFLRAHLSAGGKYPRRQRMLRGDFRAFGESAAIYDVGRGKGYHPYRLHRGDMCMLSASCVLNAITFDVFIDAEEETECFVISGPAFAAVSERNPAVRIFALETAVSRFSDVMWVMQQILFMSMDRRLAIFLSDESARTGLDTITLTHGQIARYMGSAREVVSRMLKYFAGEGIVEVSRGGVTILDKKRLRGLTV